MIVAIADTHAAIWYLYNDPRLSADARNVIETAAADGGQIGVSSISPIEIVYLVEKGRFPPTLMDRLVDALDDHDAVLQELSVDRSIVMALREIERSQVPDLPDRIIAATALRYGVPVISRDRMIRVSNVQTIW